MFEFNRDFYLGFVMGVGLIWGLPKVLEYFDEDTSLARRKKRVKRKISKRKTAKRK